jgi:hypothetical protein
MGEGQELQRRDSLPGGPSMIGPCYTCTHHGEFGRDSRGGDICFCLHPVDYTVHDAKIGCRKWQEAKA